jgi:phage terminase large subunit GpA-like protein
VNPIAELSHAAIPVLVARAARAIAPRQRLTVSQWADAHRWISSKQSGEPGQWRTDRNPILGEIMDAFSPQNPVREIWVMKSSQCGVTEATVNVLGYTMHHAPCPVMVFMPTEQERDKWKAQKLNPMLLETECIRDILGGLRSRDAANRADMIDFPGGIIFLAGGNSPNSYAQKSAKVIIVDDFDRFPSEIGEEGDPEGLVRGRAKSFPSTHKIGFISTPTIKDASLIERGFLRTDRRHYHVRCPHCGKSQRLVWQNLKWEQAKSIPTWAEYECEECGRGIGENHKPTLLRDGLWVPEAPEIITRRGYHVTALTAPIGLGPSWLALAQEFLIAKNEPGTLKTFINQNLGEPWEDQSGKLKSHELARRMSSYDLRQIPPGVLAVTAGIDTQDEWLAVSLLGWGAPLRPDGPPRLWLLDWNEIRVPQKDTTHEDLWDELEAYLHLPLLNAYGRPMKISAAGIDSRGHRAREVRAFVTRHSLRVPVYAVQGATNRMNRPIAQQASDADKGRRGKVHRSAYGLWNVGTEYCKSWIYGQLAADMERGEDERTFAFPAGLPMDYFDGLLSEVYDPEKRRFVQKPGAKYKRNEPIDTATYAYAIGHHKAVLIGMRHQRDGYVNAPAWWSRKAAELENAATDKKNKVDPDAEQPLIRQNRPAAPGLQKLPRRVGGLMRR